MKYASHILVTILMLLSVEYSDGCDTLFLRRLHHDVTVAASSGYNLPTHGYYNGYNAQNRLIPANSSFHLAYSFGYTGNTRLGRLYPGVTQGVGMSVCTFYNHDLMGTPAFAYIFQNARLYQFRPELGLDYFWNLGASYGWRVTPMISTPWNIYVNVGLLLSWDISSRLTLRLGPEFSHCSNGDTSYPNGGANLINLKVALTWHMLKDNSVKDREEIVEYESELRQKDFKDRVTYDLILGGGIRAGKVTGKEYALINNSFPFFALNFMPMYRLDRHFSAGLSLDLLADRSANLYDVIFDNETREIISFRQPPLHKQIATGLSIRGDITMPVFTVGAGVGGFVFGGGKSLKGLYTMFSLKTFITDRLFLNLTYRLSSMNYTHNLMYGLGWRFN